MTDTLTIDGSFGEGGGQIIRSALGLSLVTGRAFAIDKIRAGRKKPGLMRQHLTAVLAAAEIGRAEVEGAEIGSRRLAFWPGEVVPGDYRFSVGTAGSTTLVLQTVLPALLIADGPSNLTLEGGTHNPFAPPLDFLARSYLPLVERMGPTVTATLERPGFYPAGGGRFDVQVRPAGSLGPLTLNERGEITAKRVRAMVANLPRHIAECECRTIAKKTGWDEACFCVDEVRSAGPGNVVMIELESQHVTEVFTGFGKIGVKAEHVASGTLNAARRYIKAGAPVGEYLADQIMLPMAIGAWQGTGGGEFHTFGLSMHAKTHLEIIERFLGVRTEAVQLGRDDWQVRIADCGMKNEE
ncbi:MAG: RNA 3'-terminal phosphate cyclase [Candidatus Nealsonbacteria bacterium]|nr:RNA 3'-terminal phosphate cyclase [Candidatus Nealsonbacteria bacterium]